MIYIYDQLAEKDDMTFEYLGNIYNLKGVTKTTKIYYLTYMASGREPVLVIPTFAEQFYDAAKKINKFKGCTNDRSVRLRIKQAFKKDPDVEEYDMGGSTTYHYSLDYKSITLYMTLIVSEEENHFFLQPSFTIAKDNIFGVGNDVDVRNNPLLYQYCEEGH